MLRALPITLALALVIAAGLVHGHWTQRWSTAHTLEDAVARLLRVPMTLGDWQGRAVPMDGEETARAGIAGFIVRRYERRGSSAAVMVMLVCGRPGPIAVHTPDICYVGAGYEPLGLQVRQSLPFGAAPGNTAEFWHTDFCKPGAVVPTYLRILWSWSAGGAWEAPDNPRRRFAPRQALYKLYVIREMNKTGERIEDDPTPEFLQTLLPVLERTLFSKPLSDQAVRIAAT